MLTGDGGANATVDPCGDCGLGLARLELEYPGTYQDYLVADYSSSVSSCGVTAAPITSPTQVYFDNPRTIVSGYNTTTACTGSYVAVPTGISCDDMAERHNISTDSLLMLNQLDGGCANWPGNLTKMCVEGVCNPYMVQPNDTSCLDLARNFNITLTQLLAWNPTIDPLCQNWNRTINHVICVSNPAGYVPHDPVGGGNDDGGTPTTARPGTN